MSETTSAGRVTMQVAAGVATVELSNPGKRNAFTWGMYDALESICSSVGDDAEVRLMVIRGAGGQAFAAGTDIAQFTEFRSGDDGIAYERRVGRMLDALLAVEVPVLAVVQGPAVGAGLAVAACSDVIIATEESVFGVPVARTLGNCLPPTVVARLERRLGSGRTMAMLLTSTLLPASDAATAGFVASVVPAAALEQEVATVTSRILRGAPLTLAALKEIDRRLAREVSPADDLLRRCYGSADFREGVHAFLEHRRPDWKGR
ncbi:MAG TPA: enoyl-CoA hydratase [Propionibacteriaceae bacterium]|nr:enoyl-CoA hydratase [Propionibacteriaceae bacterium]